MKNYHKLKLLFKRLSHLQYLQRILMWDEAAMMPEGAGPGRAVAMATLNRTIQKLLIAKSTKQLIEAAKSEDTLSNWDQSNLRWMEKLYLRASCIPPSLTEKITYATLASEQAWRTLRAKNDWKSFLPFLKTSFALIKQSADKKSEYLQLSPYDVQLDEYAPNFNQTTIDGIFSSLKMLLPDLINKVITKQQDHVLEMPTPPFDILSQKDLGHVVMKALGFDFSKGRLDISHHPFCSGGPEDVRITTRYTEDEFITSLIAICHETGHALYEQGLPKKWLNQPVGKVDSMAMHESQSLLIEMEVCRSAAFCQFISPLVQEKFGHHPALEAQNLYLLMTRVKPSLIRVNADEVTYPLHVILRYEIEKALFADEIKIEDLPAVWESLMLKYLNVTPKENNALGVMQDVHWPAGIFGYFPAYTLGRLIAAQIFSVYLKSNPSHDEQIKKGNFQGLKNWLTKFVFEQASLLDTNVLLKKITGEPLNPNHFIAHITKRYLG